MGACEEASGASVHVSGHGDAPETLSDKILTLEGSVQQKEEACRLIVQDLWQSQGIPPDEEGIFVQEGRFQEQRLREVQRQEETEREQRQCQHEEKERQELAQCLLDKEMPGEPVGPVKSGTPLASSPSGH